MNEQMPDPAAPPALPSSWPEPQPPPARTSRVKAGILGVGAVVVVLAGKILLGVVAGAVVSSTLGAVFGTPYERLPSDQRSQLEARLTVAVGSGFNSLSDADKRAKVLSMLTSGLPRLSDTILIERVQLFTTSLQIADPALCATVSRGIFQGKVDDAAADKVIAGLETTSFGRWIEINVEAIEAQSGSASPARTLSSAATDAMYRAVFSVLPAKDLATITAVSNGNTVTDADVCTAARDLYQAGKSLGSTDLATFALTDVAQ
jgi:hypothetical protein